MLNDNNTGRIEIGNEKYANLNEGQIASSAISGHAFRPEVYNYSSYLCDSKEADAAGRSKHRAANGQSIADPQPGEECGQTVQDPIREYGVPSMPPPMPKNPRGNIQFLTIIGQVEGHMILSPNNKTTKYEHVIPQLVLSAENPEVDGVLILLNTVGGDVEAGLAISELISNLGKPTVSLVIGGGHSIGVPLAVSANYSFIAPSATMTIHPVRLNGTVVGAPQTYDYFNKMQERVVEFIARNCQMPRERLRQLMLETNQLMMDVGTILIGQEAVDEMLIDSTGGLYDAMEKLYEMIAERRGKDDQR